MSCYIYLQQKQISKLGSVFIHNYPSAISLVLTEKTTSNECLSISSKERYKEKTVLLREQHHLIETCIQKLENFAQT